MKSRGPIDLKNSALLVVDMQRYFLRPGAEAFLDPPADLVANVTELIERFRRAKRPVIFTRHANRRNAPPSQIRRWWGDDLPFDGDADAELDDRIAPLPDETVLTKETYSAFEGTELDSLLRKGGVDTLVICGVMTNVCVETTARHAFVKDYQPVVVSDACAGKNARFHESSIAALGYAFAYTPRSYEILL